MSKKQRDLLQAEVLHHQKEQKMVSTSISCPNDTHGEKLPPSPELSQPFPALTWNELSTWDTNCSAHPVPRTHLPKDPSTPIHNPEKVQVRKSCSRDQMPHLEQRRFSFFQRIPANQNPEFHGNPNFASCLLPDHLISMAELDLLTQNVVCAHSETCQFLQENLQVIRWETFSQSEVHGFQQKPMDHMWERCVCHITNAIQQIVEFAKRLNGFMELNPNDQIVLLKAGAMELLLLRMSRAFNCYNNTIFFEGKYAPLDLFQSLGCNDLISAMFDLCHSLCAVNLSEYEMAFYSAMILLDPTQPWLQEKEKVQSLHVKLDVAFRNLLRRTHRESILGKLPQRGRLLSICQVHMEKLKVFRQMYPGMAWERFPPLYRELFVSEQEDP
ncbi:hypothetical protein GDO86_019153 [Hymenochirus boettgeri]|uniref:NR LBD domain-containing protein n=1 Tax=Hymenochirus boettgeri TaxID=247094 RepID=A0A8T2IJF0_9PIPI|nr:hypothetical protein GDO86_019153 [Hymenochirus boettgeri]